jgi:hypothetical protein
MAHLTKQQRHRLLARSLPPAEIVAAVEHVRTCASCRDDLIALRSNKPGSLDDEISPDMRAEQHPSDDSLAAFVDDDVKPVNRPFFENHIAECEVCREIVFDLRRFRDELQGTAPKLFMPSSEKGPRGGGPSRYATGPDLNSSRRKRSPLFKWLAWFKRPFWFTIAIAATALLVFAAFVELKLSAPRELATRKTNGQASRQFAVVDRDHETQIGSDGTLKTGRLLPQVDLDTLNRLCIDALRNQPLEPAPALAALKRATPVWRGQPALPIASIRVIRPVRTLIQPGRVSFRWTLGTNAQSYTVHVVDDETQDEVAASPPILPEAKSSILAWSPEAPLSPGKRYRWYVAAVANGQEIDAPGIADSPARFAILSENELDHLNELKKANPGDALIDGLLELRTGLLDDAQDDFHSLLDEASQTPDGRVLLRRLIEGIEELKQ